MNQIDPILTVSSHTIYLNLLSTAIEIKHKCHAKHIESVPVTEERNGAFVWKGVAETFELLGHTCTTRCYAWIEISSNTEREFVIVLERGSIFSPETAVKAWLAAKAVTAGVALFQSVGSPIVSASTGAMLEERECS